VTLCSARDWQAYIDNRLTREQVISYEEHLYSCEVCLQIYMNILDAVAEEGSREAGSAVTDLIMAAIAEKERIAAKPSKKGKPKKSIPWSRRPLFQYAVAAIITLVLMSAGVFQGLSMRINHIESFTTQPKQESFSQKLMEKTVSMIDVVQSQPKGGKSNE
jgi:predicted anti-sigma-YlaC factor YlaD